MRYLHAWLLAGSVISCSFFGCGGNNAPKTYPVTGSVTFKGQPLPDVVVTFFPAGGRPATGLADAQGNFSLTTFASGDGALPGTHKVTVAPQAPKMAEGDYSVPERKPPPFPVKYTDQIQTDLTAEVKPEPENKITIDLKE